MRRPTILLLSGLLLIFIAQPLLADTYLLDAPHSEVGFSVKHLAISRTKGSFTDFDASIEYDPAKPASWKVEAVIQAASIDTGNEDRDNHLRSPEFLDVEKFPEIRFVSTGVKEASDDGARLYGELTLHGVRKSVVLDLEILGVADFMGSTKAGFSASTKIDRQDFGLKWSRALETGGLVVGNEVKIELEIEANLEK